VAKISRFHQAGCAGEGCECPWRLDYRPLGMRGARKRLEFPTKKAAEGHLAETSHRVTRGEYVPPERIPTFYAVAEEFLRDRTGRHPATLAYFGVHLRHLASLDTLRLDRINVATIERLRDALTTSGLSAKTVIKILTTCAAVFKLAVRRGYTTANPAAIAEKPRPPVLEVARDDNREESDSAPVQPDEVLGTDEIQRLLYAANPGLWRALLATVAATGMRSEEAYALQ
jgi:integrase